MSDWILLNHYRVASGDYASTPSYGFNGAFRIPINGLQVQVIASDGAGWQHVSVSIGSSFSAPSWGTMCAVKNLFWEPEDWVIQFHPAASAYVNCHPGCLHLWKPIGQAFPVPPPELVGPSIKP